MIFGIKRSSDRKIRNINRIYRVLYTFILIVTLSLVSCMPPAPTQPTVTASSASSASSALPTNTPIPTQATLTFVAEADAWVDAAKPNENNGDAETLRSDGEDANQHESFVRFTVNGVSGGVQSAQLRVYASTGSGDGPEVYLTDPTWEEPQITWDTRPALMSTVLDNKDRINGDSWVEYNVAPQVTQDGIYSFVFVADSGDGVEFSSREGNHPPELVITTGSASTATVAPTLAPQAETLVGAGDISMCDNDNDELTAQLLDTVPGTVFTTGDNVYSDGTYTQFMECYDPTWGRHKDRTRPVPGNHDYHTAGAAGYFQYFDNIPEYYAYDLGSWRIYALNSEIDVSEDSSQVAWLREDLAANPRQCVLAYWHEPRWSSGAVHGNSRGKQTLWEILYEAGAELVLNGHEHSYERFAPMNARGEPDPQGMREIVVGTGGRSLYGFDAPLPTSEVRDNTSYGVLKLTLHATSYDWEFIPAAGSTFTDSGSGECH